MSNYSRVTSLILWTARIIGSLILAFVLFFLFAYIFGDEESGDGFRSVSEIASFLLFPCSIVVGLSLAYKWEGLGGIITTTGMVGLFILRPELSQSPLMTIPLIPGLLYTFYWFLKKKPIH